MKPEPPSPPLSPPMQAPVTGLLPVLAIGGDGGGACYWCLHAIGGMVALISLSLSSHALDVLCAGINPRYQ